MYKARGGGGGTRDIYWWGVFWHIKKGGVLGAGTTQKKGGVLGAGTTRKGGVLGTSTTRKRWNLGLVL